MSEINRDELKSYLNKLLECRLYQDYGPNGLQIEGKKKIKKIAFAVSATKDSIEKTIENKCDTLIVHHGLFWKFHGVRTITGTFAKRVLPLCQNEINLFGYHLPLDANIVLGNAKSLGEKLGMRNFQAFGDYKKMPTGVWGEMDEILVTDLERKIGEICQHSVLTSTHNRNTKIKTMGIITGGANNDWFHSEKLGLDAFLTGEMSEHNWNEAKEAEITMFAAGHHATERFGIQSLMEHIQNKYQINCVFFDSENPA